MNFIEKKAAELFHSAISEHHIPIGENDLQKQLTEELNIAQNFKGLDPNDPLLANFVFSKNERVVYLVKNAGLDEYKTGAGHVEGRSAGVSVPIGHSGVHVRTGQVQGHYVKGKTSLTRVDSGELVITTKRIIFRGQRQSRQIDFSKLAGFSTHNGYVSFSLSNRKAEIIFHHGTIYFDFRLRLALSIFQDTRDEFIRHLEEQLQNSSR